MKPDRVMESGTAASLDSDGLMMDMTALYCPSALNRKCIQTFTSGILVIHYMICINKVAFLSLFRYFYLFLF